MIVMLLIMISLIVSPRTNISEATIGIFIIVAGLLFITSSAICMVELGKLGNIIRKVRYFDAYSKQVQIRIEKLEIHG